MVVRVVLLNLFCFVAVTSFGIALQLVLCIRFGTCVVVGRLFGCRLMFSSQRVLICLLRWPIERGANFLHGCVEDSSKIGSTSIHAAFSLVLLALIRPNREHQCFSIVFLLAMLSFWT